MTGTALPERSLLAFPLTPFTDSGLINLDVLAEHIEILLSWGAKGVFAACGTGEMPSLSTAESETVLRTATEVVDGRVPVIAGVGFGLAVAKEMLQSSAAVGAEAALVFPPYLGPTSDEALYRYYAELASVSDLGIILYQRGMSFSADVVRRLAAHESIIGLKDGNGQIEVVQAQSAAVVDRADFQFFNGTPTAELYAPALMRIGVSSYSSALLNALPEFSAAFNGAFLRDDAHLMRDLIQTVVLPFVRIRDRSPGYAVSLVKLIAELRGLDTGSVRSPLPIPSDEDRQDLQRLLEDIGLDTPLKRRTAGTELDEWRTTLDR